MKKTIGLVLLCAPITLVADYDESADRSVEFSLDDGASETAFDYVDEEELKLQQKVLERKKAVREKHLRDQVAQEDQQEHDNLMKNLRGKKLAEIKKRDDILKQKRLAAQTRKSLSKLDNFHHGILEKDSNWAHRPAPVKPAEAVVDMPTSHHPSDIVPQVSPAGAQRSPSAHPADEVAQAPVKRDPQALKSDKPTQGLRGMVEKAGVKIQSLWSSFKKLIWQ